MQRSLLLDVPASRSAALSATISAETGGLLTAPSLSDATIRALLDRAQPEWKSEPTLLEVDGAAGNAFTGMALRGRLVTLLGPRRGWRVAQIVAESQVPGLARGETRRGFIQRATAVAAGLAGVALLGPAPLLVKAQEVEAESVKKPGKYSRRAGIEAWKVKKTSTGYTVNFDHEKKRLSGRLTVSYSRDGRTGTTVLKRDEERFEMAFSGRQLAATNADGQSMTARWNSARGKWDIDAQSERRFEDNKRDLEISFAIAADLSMTWGNRGLMAEAAATETRGLCAEDKEVVGEASDWSGSRACDWAKTDAQEKCEQYSPGCDGCCRMNDAYDLRCPLEWISPIQNFGCNCMWIGHPYPKNGFC